MKTILKEIIITLLICVAILLILGIIFYDYNPLNKVIPNKIAYSTPNEIRSEITDTEIENILDQSYNIVYSIENADLQKYKKSDRYVPGKEHPFTGIESATGDVIYGEKGPELTQAGIAEKENDDLPSSGSNKNPDSTDKYFNNTGKK